MTALIATLAKQATIVERGCTLTIANGRYLMTKGEQRHSIDVDCSCERRLAAHWAGFVDIQGDAVQAVKPVAKKVIARAYMVAITPTDFVAGMSMEPSEAGEVMARDRNEAMRKARDIGRDLIGPYGPGYKVSVRLSN